MATRLSTLDGLRVVDAQGRSLGRIWDLRTAPRAGGAEGKSRVVAAVLVGPAALLERLDFKCTGGGRLAWKKVVEVAPDHLVVE